MQPTDVTQLVPVILGLVHQHAWLALAVLAMGFLARVMKDDTKLPFFNIPARWQSVLVLVLGQVYAGLQAVFGGMPWTTAMTQGLIAAFLTMGLFDLIVKAVLDGRDMPTFLAWLLKFERTVDVTAKSKDGEAHLTVDARVETPPPGAVVVTAREKAVDTPPAGKQ